MKRLHLICNAHIDPAWLWEWEDGAAAALATFRSAAALAERFDYVFCHNEALLYQWVEEHDAGLFRKIQALVKAGKWHIAGGWFLQPDCTMPTGETFARLIARGRSYFFDRFGVTPTTAVNYDAFGHSVGLVQILKKCGYDAYLCCRPGRSALFPDDRFRWIGLDGGSVECARVSGHYNSAMGAVDKKILPALEKAEPDVDVLLWGVGNHGGGPSAEDLTIIERMRSGGSPGSATLLHSTPERFFAEADKSAVSRARSLNPCMPGCYASMARVKAGFRRLENRLFEAEAICAHAAAAALAPYPAEALASAEHDLMLASFHDILPGTGIQPVEAYALRLLSHGEEILSRARLRAFLAMLKDEAPAAPGEYPAFIYNPLPYPRNAVADISFNLADQNWSDTFTDFVVMDGDRAIPSQVVQPYAPISLDWMKRVVFSAELPPSAMARFRLLPVRRGQKPAIRQPDGAPFSFENGEMRAEIDITTGLLTRYEAGGVPLIHSPAFSLAVYRDNADPWAMSASQQIKIGTFEGAFRLMTPEESACQAGISAGSLAPVRIVEQGDVLTEVESAFAYGQSSARVVYRFYTKGAAFDVSVFLFNQEKDAVIRLRVPAAAAGVCDADTAYGYETIPSDGQDWPMQKWVCAHGDAGELAVLNDASYAVRQEDRTIEIALARAAAHAAHPIHDRPILPDDRFIARIDQGDTAARFRILGGEKGSVLPWVNREAFAFNTPPFAMCAFPGGAGTEARQPFVLLRGGDGVILSALRREGARYLVRLHNNADRPAQASFECPLYRLAAPLHFAPFEIKTLTLSEKGIAEHEGMLID